MQISVLVVDDEPIIRFDLVELLEEAGYEVIGQAGNGEDALELTHRLRPSLIVMDVDMPGLDGVQAAAQIMKWYDPAIVLLTSYSNQEIVDRAKRSFVSGYVTKPFSEHSLLPALEIALSQRERASQLRQEMDQLERKLAERKWIEQAKGLLMSAQGMTEQEAHSELRARSMQQRKSMAELAAEILRSHNS